MKRICLVVAFVSSCWSEPGETNLTAKCEGLPMLLDCANGPCVCAQDASFCGDDANDGATCCSPDGQSNVIAIGVCMKNECVEKNCVTSR